MLQSLYRTEIVNSQSVSADKDTFQISSTDRHRQLPFRCQIAKQYKAYLCFFMYRFQHFSTLIQKQAKACHHFGMCLLMCNLPYRNVPAWTQNCFPFEVTQKAQHKCHLYPSWGLVVSACARSFFLHYTSLSHSLLSTTRKAVAIPRHPRGMLFRTVRGFPNRKWF